MPEDTPRPQINSAKIAFGGGIAGAIFTIGSMAILLTGLPVLCIYFLRPSLQVAECARFSLRPA